MMFLKDFLNKILLKKVSRRQQKFENLPSMQRVNDKSVIRMGECRWVCRIRISPIVFPMIVCIDDKYFARGLGRGDFIFTLVMFILTK